MDFRLFSKRLQSDLNFAVFHYEKAEPWDYELAHDYSVFQYMIDIWADANALVSKCQSGASREQLQQLLNTFHNRCGLLYQIYDDIDDLVYECKINEWILHDYVVGNNEFNMTGGEAMKWFDEFYYHRKPQSQ